MIQDEFDFDPPDKPKPLREASLEFDEAAFVDFMKGGSWPLIVQFKAFILAHRSGTQHLCGWFRNGIERRLGYPFSSVAGTACLQLWEEGYLEKTGDRGAPRDPKSHNSKNEIWRRTDKPWKFK